MLFSVLRSNVDVSLERNCVFPDGEMQMVLGCDVSIGTTA
jgi:hypothetical protein